MKPYLCFIVSTQITTQGGYLISKIHQLSGRIFSKLLKESEIEDLNPAQGRILFALWKKDNVPISTLAKETQLHKSTLTKMLDRLAESGHLKREPSKRDRRVVTIRLTVKNQLLREKYETVSKKMRDIYYKDIPSEEVQMLDRLLNKVLSNLIEHEEAE
jgi:DNA-binding MarR family transcriptional regulator